MYKYTQAGQGHPPPFVPASQQSHQQRTTAQQRSTRAVPIVTPSPAASPSLAPTGSSGAAPNGANAGGGAMSPSKAALTAKAASAAVFVPKGTPVAAPATLSTPSLAPDSSSSSSSSGGGGSSHFAPTRAMSEMSMVGPSQQQQPHQLQSHSQRNYSGHFNPYLASESGQRTPSSYGQAGYDIDPSHNAFDPTYAGPFPEAQGAPPGLGPSNSAQDASGNGGQRSYNPYEHLNEYGEPTSGLGPSRGDMMSGGMDLYGGAAQNLAAAKIRQPLQYHLYAPPMPHVSNLHPQHLSANAFFMSSEEREELQRKNDALHAGVPPPEFGGPKLPEELHVYHSLVPLEPSPLPGMAGNGVVPQLIDPRIVPPTAPGTVNHMSGACGEASRVFGYQCHVYKAQCTLDGKRYVLRRLENFRLTHEAAIGLVERWRRIRHPSIVSVREAFTTRAFGDSSIVFVYDYHPLAATLYAEHMVPKAPQPDRRTGRLQSKSMQIPERTLWSYLCQLTNVLRSIHHHGLAARCIEPSKVLRTGKNRVRLNCCSIFDVIAYDANASVSAVQSQQGEDLVNLGKLLASLACNSISAMQNVDKSLEHIARVYSQDLKAVILWLLSPPGSVPRPAIGASAKKASEDGISDPSTSSNAPLKTAEELVQILGPKYAEEFDSALNQDDLLEMGLSKELENARLVRLLCKFGFINERPEYDHDPRWSETGDRYIVKLFRDHVFHAIDPAGRPVVDLSHILTNLNKLDAGSLEKIMLTSRDEQSCLVVSYREIKSCVDAAFADLSRAR